MVLTLDERENSAIREMERFKLYNMLTDIPLFMGMDRIELEQIVSKTKLNFKKIAEGETIFMQGDTCGFLAMLIYGEIETIATSDDYSYEVHEYFSAPATLQTDRIFGRMQIFPQTYKAITPCNLIIIDKTEVLKLASNSFIFRLNLLSLLSTSLQKKAHEPWKAMPTEVSKHIVRFIITHCTYPAGRKIFKIKMQYLADILHTTRLVISKELNTLQNKQLVTLGRGRIVIDALEKLIGAEG